MTTSTSLAAYPSCSAASGPPSSSTVPVAPRAVSADSLPASRPAAMTCPAPKNFATCTASCPALPVAPRMRTSWAGSKATRWRRPTQEDMAGFIAAATATGSLSSGSTTLRRVSMTVCSAIAPIVVSGRMK